MGSAYTYDVLDGTLTDLNSFVWKCVKATDVMQGMRAQAANAPISLQVEPDTQFYLERVQISIKLLKELTEELSQEQLLERYHAYCERTRESQENADKTVETCNARVEAMLDKVGAWLPPTKNHTALKLFMIKQLEMSKYQSRVGRPVVLRSFKEWFAEEKRYCLDLIDSYSADIESRIKGAEFATKYLEELNKSVPIPEHLQAK